MMPRLPDCAWRRDAGLLRVIAALQDGGGGPRVVGGGVRDCLLGLPVTDIDLATPITPRSVIRRLEQDDIKAIPTGIEHGTVTAVANGNSFEITTLRRDVATDGRRAIVAFSDDWREDAARRDFTINALYADPASGEIFDYFGGLADLERRYVRFIGDPQERIAEDHLRILRYFRFLARFDNGAADDAALAACAAGAAKMMALSRERIASELLKILSLPDPTAALALMIEQRIFAPFLPELADDALPLFRRLVARERAAAVQTRPTTRLIALIGSNGDAADRIAVRLKLSRRMRREMTACVGGRNIIAANIRAFAYAHDAISARDAALLYAPDGEVAACLSLLQHWQIPEFPVKGGDIIRRGIPPGPMVAKIMQQIETAWIDEGFPGLPRTDMLIDQAVAQSLLAAKKR